MPDDAREIADEAAKVVAGLTDGQRQAVWRAITTRHMAQRLRRKGLVQRTEATDCGVLVRLTPLGMAVRTILQTEASHAD